MSLEARIVAALAVIISASMTPPAQAAPFSLELNLNGFYENTSHTIIKNLLVNGIPTALPNGVSIKIDLDDTTPDTDFVAFASHGGFGVFAMVAASLTSVDLGIANMLITGPGNLRYFEGGDSNRAGLAPADLCCSIQVAPGSAATGIGNPNLLDTIPDMIGGDGSFWAGTTLTLQNGMTIGAQSSGLTFFGQSSLTPFEEEESAPVPEPASVALVGLGVAGVAVQLRRRSQRR